jgi:hypothetical protein
MTQHLYEKGSAESKQPRGSVRSAAVEWLREHSLTLFLLVMGIAWVVAFKAMDLNSKWGQVVGNIVSEWTQDPGVGSDDQAHGGGWFQSPLTAVLAAHAPSPMVQIDSSNQ